MRVEVDDGGHDVQRDRRTTILQDRNTVEMVI